MSGRKERLDKLLVERGLVESRSQGKLLVMAGEVLVDGAKAVKSSIMVKTNASIEVVAPALYVSRGGHKLAAALQQFEISVAGRICADVGACTGGFTDVLLQSEAARVYAIDVGYGQLDWKLRQNPNVIVLERTNARYLETLPEMITFASIDVSFISLRLILPVVRDWLAEGGEIVALIKPQFEAGPQFVGKGGIVRSPEVHARVLGDVLAWSGENGLQPAGLMRSPITGAEGNIEFLAWLRSGDVANLNIQVAIDHVTG